MNQERINRIIRDRKRITSISDGNRWFQRVIPGSVQFDDQSGTLSFDVRWTDGSVKSFTLGVEHVAGYGVTS